ncbi:hypothetical protein F8M41_025889 [Gigaspora margarita]|uniref:Uncharacterized protein n=1 Tax=Gigaspora margarita TaxID=4874 RepID=A0A8H4AAQ7_GIGMA|nr:hypothetical protein F8M41_025889 [Gigaspora margarita]
MKSFQPFRCLRDHVSLENKFKIYILTPLNNPSVTYYSYGYDTSTNIILQMENINHKMIKKSVDCLYESISISSTHMGE